MDALVLILDDLDEAMRAAGQEDLVLRRAEVALVSTSSSLLRLLALGAVRLGLIPAEEG